MLLILLVLSLIQISSQTQNKTDNVTIEEVLKVPNSTQISESFFDQYVMDKNTLKMKKNNAWIILFYSPFCPSCQGMFDDWNYIYDKNKDGRVKIGQVNCKVFTGRYLCEQFNITGYPTILYLDPKESKSFEYLWNLHNKTSFEDFMYREHEYKRF